jgi:hypothetical protein
MDEFDNMNVVDNMDQFINMDEMILMDELHHHPCNCQLTNNIILSINSSMILVSSIYGHCIIVIYSISGIHMIIILNVVHAIYVVHVIHMSKFHPFVPIVSMSLISPTLSISFM